MGTHPDLQGSNILRNLFKSRQFSYDCIKCRSPPCSRVANTPNSYTGGHRFKRHATYARTHARTHARTWSRCVSLLIPSPDARWGWLINFTLRLFYQRIKAPVQIYRGQGLSGWVWRTECLLPLPGFGFRNVQPIARTYNDYFIVKCVGHKHTNVKLTVSNFSVKWVAKVFLQV